MMYPFFCLIKSRPFSGLGNTNLFFREYTTCQKTIQTGVVFVVFLGFVLRKLILYPLSNGTVAPNGVAFRATVLAQQARRLKMPLHWGPQTSSMALPPRHIATGYKRCSPLLLRMTLQLLSARRLQLMQMACGRLGRSSAFIRALRPP